MSRRPLPSLSAMLVCLVVTAVVVAGCSDSSSSGRSSDQPVSTPAATPATPSPAGTLPSGQLIVFERAQDGSEDRALYAVSPVGGEPTLVRSPGDSAHWSPDGSRLAFLACMDPPECVTALAVLDRSGGKVDWAPWPDPDLETHCSVWDPTARRLACEVLSERSTRNGVYTLRASDGGGLTRVTRNPGGDDVPLAFSPDGDLLLLHKIPPSGAASALFVVPVRGGRPRMLTTPGLAEGDAAGWTPDGRTIVFAGTEGTVYRVQPDGKALRPIPLRGADGSAVSGAFDVSVSPDGRSLVFSLGGPSQGIYRAPLAGGEVKRLTSGDDHHATWGAAGS